MDQDDRLADIRILDHLPRKARAKLARVCVWRRFREGDVIASPDPATPPEIGFVLSGLVRVSWLAAPDGRLAYADIGAGGHFGVALAFDALQLRASALAASDCEIVWCPAAAFRRAAENNAALAVALLDEMAQAMRAKLARDLGGIDRNPAQRVYGELVRRASLAADGRAWRVAPMPRHREIAEAADTSEEGAAEALAGLIRAGIARRAYPALEIVDLGRLRALADGS